MKPGLPRLFTTRAWVACGAVLITIASSTSARAQTTSDPVQGQSVENLLSRLNDESFAVREKATEELRALREACRMTLIPGMGKLLERQFYNAFIRPDLSLEQETRVLRVAREHFFESERGGVGMRWAAGNADADRGLVIDLTVAGFPCHDLERLNVGDVVTSVAGQKLDQQSLLELQAQGKQDVVRATIMSYDPGDAITMRVIRPPKAEDEGEREEIVTIPLGRFSQLENLQPPPPATLEQAWKIRLKRFGVSLPSEVKREVLPSATSIKNWLKHNQRPRDPLRTSLTIGHFHPGASETLAPQAQLAGGIRQIQPEAMKLMRIRQLAQAQESRRRALGALSGLQQNSRDAAVRLQNQRLNSEERLQIAKEIEQLAQREMLFKQRIGQLTQQIMNLQTLISRR